ncbi:hypothetical protein VTN49DRAFT_1959 [Thermomyces lanuginosus]|uniref:uncharacterized protein n=1 Tax=Thermomyces lanuginosus TaxID=5541 RepID=UPI0037437E6E
MPLFTRLEKVKALLAVPVHASLPVDVFVSLRIRLIPFISHSAEREKKSTREAGRSLGEAAFWVSPASRIRCLHKRSLTGASSPVKSSPSSWSHSSKPTSDRSPVLPRPILLSFPNDRGQSRIETVSPTLGRRLNSLATPTRELCALCLLPDFAIFYNTRGHLCDLRL